MIDASSDRIDPALDANRQPTIRMQRRGLVVYVALGALLFVAMIGHTINESWASPDFWVYLAAVREFAAHPLDPSNPLMVGTDPDPYLSPYTWVLGGVTRVTGADGVTVLALAGMVNLSLLLAGLYRLVTTLSSRWLAPALVLVLTLFAWGTPPWRWAGFFNANSIGTVLPLGSTFASALALFALSAAVRWMRSGARAEIVLVAAATPLIITCHPFTATWTAAVALGFVVGTADRTNRRRVGILVAVAAAAAGLAAAWPFYPVLELPGASGDLEAINAAIFHRVVPRTFLALPGLLAVGLRLRKRWRDPIVLGLAATATLFVVGWVLDRPTLGRSLPAVLLMLHLALADLVAGLLEDRGDARQRSTIIAAMSLAIAVGAAGTAAGMVRAVPRALLPASLADRPELASLVDDPYRTIDARISREDVVVASTSRLAAASAGVGGKVVGPFVPAPFVDDVRERQRATDTILDPDAPAAQRQRALRRYGVDWLVLTPRDAQRLRRAGAFSDGSLDPTVETPTFVMVHVGGYRRDISVASRRHAGGSDLSGGGNTGAFLRVAWDLGIR
jgi:hypothetical protein